MMKRICPHPPTYPPNLGEGEPEWGARMGSQNFKLPLPNLGEGFRERVKTPVLNLDKVYFTINPTYKSQVNLTPMAFQATPQD